jgi:integrase
MSKALTDASIRALKPPAEGRIEVTDPACRGLALRVTAAGAKTFAFRYRDRTTKRAERLWLGQYPDLTLAAARAKADELRGQIVAGKNPSAHKREASSRAFGALADRYLAEHARRFKRSADADERALNVHVLPKWRDRDFTTIARADVIKLVEGIITAGKPVMANRVQALVSSIFSFAVDSDLVQTNPCSRLRKRGQETAKTRVLSDDEIRLFWDRAVLPPVSPSVGLALRLALVTGARVGEIAGMTRAELELEQGEPVAWTIPETRSKNGRAHFLPLSSIASSLIVEALELADADEQRRAAREGRDPRGILFVFPSRGGDGPVEGHTLTVAMRRLGDKLPNTATTWHADPPTAHDLRRSCATRLAAAGVRSEDVMAVLNHTPHSVTKKHYDLYERAKEKREALDRWGLILSAILNPPSPNVIPMREVANA